MSTLGFFYVPCKKFLFSHRVERIVELICAAHSIAIKCAHKIYTIGASTSGIKFLLAFCATITYRLDIRDEKNGTGSLHNFMPPYKRITMRRV